VTNVTQKRLLWALLASIGVNVFLLGFVFARALGPRPPPAKNSEHRGPPTPDGVFGLDSPETRRVLRERKGQLAPQRRALRDARSRVGQALEADPYVPEALEKALSDLRNRTTDMQAEVHRALVDLSSKLTPEQRRDLARRNLRGPRRRPRGGPE